MFHVEPIWRALISKNRGTSKGSQITRLLRYRDWLLDEALPAGGIGPGEQGRVDLRHITDSLLFLELLPETSSVLDVGSGVGLPGIPLAIACPEIEFRLMDRSGRRVDLMRRASRILKLENLQVVHGDFTKWRTMESTIVSRATIPPERMLPLLHESLSPGGVALLGGSWTQPPVAEGYQVREVGTENLDQPVWILKMQQT